MPLVAAALLTFALWHRGRFSPVGPILWYDLVRTGRRRRYLVMRGVYGLFLAATVFVVYACRFLGSAEPLKDMLTGPALPAAELAEFAASFFYVFFVIQLLVVFVLTPAYAAGVLAEEKERHTLEALLATDLLSREIVLGLFLSRLANLAMLVATGLPILGFLQFLGGVEPGLLLASFGFTGLTMLSLAGLSVLNSVLARRPRDAVVRTYLVAFGYLVVSGLSWLALYPSLGLASFPSTDHWISPITLEDLIHWFSAGNLVAVIVHLVQGVQSGATLGSLLPGYLGGYAAFHGVITVGACVWAVARLRSATLDLGGAEGETLVNRRGLLASVGRRPMLWKELRSELGQRRRWFGWLLQGCLLAAVLWPAVAVMAFFDRVLPASPNDHLSEVLSAWVRGLGTAVACFMLVQVAVRAAGSLSGEREQQTLDSLLATPLRNRSILFAKWLGSVGGVRTFWPWLAVIWGVGLATGALHPLAVPCVVLAWLVFAGFQAALGLWFSVASRTTRHATVLTLLALVAVLIATYLAVVDFAGTPLPVLETYCFFPPNMLGLLAFSPADLEGFLPMLGQRQRLVFLADLAVWALAALALWKLANVRFRVVTGRPDEPTDDDASPASEVPGEPASAAHARQWARSLARLALLLLPLGAMLAGYAYWRLAAEENLRQAVAETDRLDPGWRLDELEARRPVLPDDQNAALLVLAVQAATPTSNVRQGAVPDVNDPSFLSAPPQQQLNARQVQALADKLRELETALAIARRIKDVPQGRFPPDNSSSAVTQVAKLLQWDAFLRAHERQADGALEDCLATVHLCRAVGDEPGMVAQLTRNGVQETAFHTLERVLGQGEPSDALLATLQQRLAEEAEFPLILCALRGERAQWEQSLEKLQAGNAQGMVYVPIHRGTFPGPDETALLASGPLKNLRAESLRVNTALVEAARLPVAQQSLATSQVMNALGPVFNSRRMFSPAFQIAWWRPQIQLNQARLRAAVIVLAAERFRRAHGRWPENLSEMTPAFLEKVPDDPYDGNPLRYRRLADGVVAYAVGPDGADNGGDLSKPMRRVGLPPGKDVGIRLWDAARRRQPPAEPAPK